MPNWQERITHDTRPAIRAEHELRYALAAPLIRATARWCDLGCGAGVGAAAALDGDYDGRALLVDLDQQAAEQAAETIPAGSATALAADLSDAADLARVAEAAAALAADGPLCVTCFEVVEHLESFAPLVEMLTGLAGAHDCTVVLSVPNDAFWAIESPFHQTTWGEGAVQELRGLLPADHVLLHQVALQGSAVVPVGESARASADVELFPGVPSHFLLAFGPRAAELAAAPRVVQTEIEEQRRWERQRESDLLYYVRADRLQQSALEQARRELDQARTDLRAEIDRVVEFRAYIHELERRLGERPGDDVPAPAAPDDEADAPAASGHA